MVKVTKKYTFEDLEKQEVDKWQKASIELTQAKVVVENILKEFNEEDRKDIKYKQLFESLEITHSHINADFNPTYKAGLKRKKIISIIKNIFVVLGSIILGIIVNSPTDIGSLIVKFFGGK